MPSKNLLTICALLAIILNGCGTKVPYYSFENRKWDKSVPPEEDKLEHTLFLVGDSGDPIPNGDDPLFNLLQYHLYQNNDSTQGSGSSLVFLGDNIYEHGLPERTSQSREKAQEAIEIQLDAVKDFNGRIVYIPGNHDWDHSSPGGYRAVIRQQKFIEEYLKRDSVFLPKGGCPGPVEVPLSDDLVMIFLDSEWYLHEHFKPSYPDCTVEDDEDFFFEFSRAVKRNEGKHIIVFLHHPLYSNGNHGGFFSVKDNIFPLSLVIDNLYLPLPVLGSFYTLFRKYGISNQDIPNSRYQEMKDGLLESIKDVKNITFASGHDHNLQLKRVEDKHFIVSGSGSKVNYARKGRGATYVQSAQGFSKVKYYANGEVWVEFYTVSDEPEGQLTYRGPLYSLDPNVSPIVEVKGNLKNYSDSTKTVIAGGRYAASGFRRFWLGDHYRDEWITPVRVDYLPINSFAGGLTPIKRGGGKQTISLRMMGADGNQYNLRSINKNPLGAVPEPFRNTFAQDLVHDQISSAHPYGAFTIPPLADAAKVYHTNPKLVYIPYSPILGEYISTFGGMTALMEVRPDEDLSEFSRFGRSENAVSTSTMMEELMDDNDNQVDQTMFLRSRLFDLFINDWDRHEDQWRWSEVDKDGKGDIFEPIPRDRDQVYTKYDGFIPWLVSRKWAIRNLTHFGHDYEDPLGTMLSGNALDRRFLNQLTKEQWDAEVFMLQTSLTDSVIEYAARQMPEEVFKISGEEIIEKLKSRRDNLTSATDIWYKALSKEIDVLGSNKHEYFVVHRYPDDRLKVTVYKTKKDGEIDKTIYERTFDAGLTKEVRIYTFEGNDQIEITGEDSGKILVRVIVGSETEAVRNKSSSDKVIVYKKKYYDEVEIDESLKVRSSNRKGFVEYDPAKYQYSYLGPRISIQFNPDAGLFLGGGINWKTFGFNRSPYKSSNTLIANYATNLDAYNISYLGEFPDILSHDLDLVVSSHYYSPQFVRNFFGEGNGTLNERSIDFYRVDIQGFSQKVFLQKSVSESIKLGVGPTFNYYLPKEDNDNISTDDRFIDSEELENASFVGGEAYFNIDKRDNSIYPRNGLMWKNQVNYFNNVLGDHEFVYLNTDLSLYLTPNLPFYITFATRFGVDSNVGDYPFYQSNFIGGNSNLRGFRMQRFSGRTAVYNNTELRLGISRVKSYVFNGYWGVFGFIDHGRVWTDETAFDSSTWNRGHGPGIWVNFFKFIMTSAGYGFSDEGDFFYVRAGMFF